MSQTLAAPLGASIINHTFIAYIGMMQGYLEMNSAVNVVNELQRTSMLSHMLSRTEAILMMNRGELIRVFGPDTKRPPGHDEGLTILGKVLM